jgi:hypothetical protein
MALTSGALETCALALGIDEPYRTGRFARLFFVLEAHGPQGAQDAREPGALPVGRRDPEPRDMWRSRALPTGPRPLDTWRCQSPPYQGGGLWSRWTRGNLIAHLGWEAGSSAVGQVAARGCTPCSLSCLEVVHGDIRSAGYRQWPPDPPWGRQRTHRWGQHLFSPRSFSEISSWLLEW